MHEAVKKRRVHALIAVLITAVGFLLLIGKMVADSEPGAIPILLVLVGSGWLFLKRSRGRG